MIVAEKLHTAGVMMETHMHELYRVIHVHRAGLTDKETEYLKTTREMQEEVNNRTHRIMVRARQQL